MTNIAPSTHNEWPESAIPEKWVESLFEKMVGYYGSKFADQWRESDPRALKRLWATELGKLSRLELKHGVDQLVTLEWPPSLPQFIKLCRPTVDPTVAYYEALAGCAARERGEMGEWSSPAVYWASVKVGPFDLKNMSYSQIKVRWERVLQDEISKGAWSDIPLPRIALPSPDNAPLSREAAAQRISELKAAGIFKSPDGVKDGKEWARKILRRVEQGDKTVSLIQISFAKEALNNGVENGSRFS